MRILCRCGAIPCWWYCPAGEWPVQSRALCADCVPRHGDDLPGYPDDHPLDWYGQPADAFFTEWPDDPEGLWEMYRDGTPGYWLWRDPFDKNGRVLPDCEFAYVGYHKRKWQWLKRSRVNAEILSSRT